ncbi:MAG: riboflavin synthase [Nitrospinae bacterium]|nr:riboflavin synthase [Nitrospinota bacterium]
MFTGIIEGIGTVTGVTRRAADATIAVRAGDVVRDPVIGESVACDGVCLTVVKAENGVLSFDVSAETIARSTLRDIAAGRKLNLERALRMGDRLGGHMVSGHVDTVGSVGAVTRSGAGYLVEISLPADGMRYIIEKGSIAIDGISLTVATRGAASVTLALIPHTWSATSLREKGPGKPVNVEYDMIAKYVENFVRPAESSPGGGGVDEAFLKSHGF